MKNSIKCSIVTLFLVSSGILLPMKSITNDHAQDTQVTPIAQQTKNKTFYEVPDPMMTRLKKFNQINVIAEISDKNDATNLDITDAVKIMSSTIKLSTDFVYTGIVFCAHHLMSIDAQTIANNLKKTTKLITDQTTSLNSIEDDIASIDQQISSLNTEHPTTYQQEQATYQATLTDLKNKLQGKNTQKSKIEQMIWNFREEEEKQKEAQATLEAEQKTCKHLLDKQIQQTDFNSDQLIVATNFAKLYNYLNMESENPHKDGVAATMEFVEYVQTQKTLPPFTFSDDLQKKILVIDKKTMEHISASQTTTKPLTEILSNHVTDKVQDRQMTAKIVCDHFSNYTIARGLSELTVLSSSYRPEDNEHPNFRNHWEKFIKQRTNELRKNTSLNSEQQASKHMYFDFVATEALYEIAKNTSNSSIDSMRLSTKIDNLRNTIPNPKGCIETYKDTTMQTAIDGIFALVFGALATATYHKLLLYATGYNNAARSWTSHIATGIGGLVTLSASMVLDFESQEFDNNWETTPIGAVAKIIGSPISSAIHLTRFLWGNVQRYALRSEATRNLQEITQETSKVIESNATQALLACIKEPETRIFAE